MGKHKKFLKSEKAKVKLKGTKLKAAQNVTKTDFKVRKIIITEQLKNVQDIKEGERKKHNVSNCITRLKSSASAEAISNLKEIILYQPEDFQRNLENIIKTVANLSLSIEKNDRKECFKILELICSTSNENILKPFMPILITYLKCALTHIKPSIQEDSLFMLDILLKYAPEVIPQEKEALLTPYLDMVSKMKKESNPALTSERSLSIQMGNKITSVRWRTSVLERLILFLKCVNSYSKLKRNEDEKEVKEIIVNGREINCNPYQFFSIKTSISLRELEERGDVKFKESEAIVSSVVKHVNMIMPLMFETWIELKDPSASEGNLISNDNSVILKLIMDIMLELFTMIKDYDYAKQQFLKKYQDRFEKQIMSHFPYTQSTNNAKKMQEMSGGQKCIYQNLSISILYLAFTLKNRQRFWKYRENVFAFIDDCINNWRAKDQEFVASMENFILTFFHQKELRGCFGTEAKHIFNELAKKCNVDQTSFDVKLALVCEIIECSGNALSSENLISQMVHVLAYKNVIPLHLIRTLSSIARRGQEIFFESFERCAIDIAKNLSSGVKIYGKTKREEKENDENYFNEIINLFYWINDKQVVSNLHDFLKTQENSISLKIQHVLLSRN